MVVTDTKKSTLDKGIEYISSILNRTVKCTDGVIRKILQITKNNIIYAFYCEASHKVETTYIPISDISISWFNGAKCIINTEFHSFDI